MLAFAPEVESALRWFDVTHELMNADGRYWFHRTGLPGAGVAGNQDAKLMEAITVLEQVHQELLTTPAHG